MNDLEINNSIFESIKHIDEEEKEYWEAMVNNLKGIDKVRLVVHLLEKYYFSTELKEEQYYDAFIWIVLKYTAKSRCFIFQKCEEEYRKSRELISK